MNLYDMDHFNDSHDNNFTFLWPLEIGRIVNNTTAIQLIKPKYANRSMTIVIIIST